MNHCSSSAMMLFTSEKASSHMCARPSHLQCVWPSVLWPKVSQKRLVADPNVGVRELQAVFVNFLKTQPTKDLLAVLGPSKSCKRVDWKSAPLAEGDDPCAKEISQRTMKLHINATKMLQSKYKNTKFTMIVIKTYLKSMNWSVSLV